MNKFQLGDVVIAKTNPEYVEKWKDVNYGEINIEGKIGKVIHINVNSGTSQNTMVEFFKPIIGGHNGKIGDIGGKNGHCWCCDENFLELIK